MPHGNKKRDRPAATGTASGESLTAFSLSGDVRRVKDEGGIVMAEELRELRLAKQIPAKDMVAVVQRLYPKYDKTVQSKCENGETYGVSLRPDAMAALYAQFAPELAKPRNAVKRDKHRLTCRISARLETADYEALQQLVAAEGYATMQDWLTATVRAYIARDGDSE